MAQVLWNWERLTGDVWAREALEALLAAEGGSLERNPGAQPLLAGLVASRALPPVEVVVSGPDMPAIAPLLRAARESAPAGALVLPLLRREDPLAYPLFDGRGGGRPRAFVCVDRSCDLPVEDAAELREKLEAARRKIRAAYREALGKHG